MAHPEGGQLILHLTEPGVHVANAEEKLLVVVLQGVVALSKFDPVSRCWR